MASSLLCLACSRPCMGLCLPALAGNCPGVVEPRTLSADSPNPTKLGLPSSEKPPALLTPSSWLILSPSSIMSLPLAHVVRPPADPVAEAEPTVLRSLASTGLPAASKYPIGCDGYEVVLAPGPKCDGPGPVAAPVPAPRTVDTRSRPASREIRSARSASRVFVDESEPVESARWCECGGPWPLPLNPSLMAVVERADREVVVELGVPLSGHKRSATSGQLST
jgi:hypothetical protein